MLDTRLIPLTAFYVSLMFLISSYRRFAQYRKVTEVAISGPKRWPKLIQLIQEHHYILINPATLIPLGLGLAVTLSQVVSSTWLLPAARDAVTVEFLLKHWLWTPIVVPLGLAMLCVDVYFLFRVGDFDRGQLEKHFDQAEYWLGSTTSRVVHAVTFGFVNPRKMVTDEVRKALAMAGDMLNESLWWWNLQIALRFFFGLSLWTIWWTFG